MGFNMNQKVYKVDKKPKAQEALKVSKKIRFALHMKFSRMFTSR